MTLKSMAFYPILTTKQEKFCYPGNHLRTMAESRERASAKLGGTTTEEEFLIFTV